jgi:large subunit ribosomal protein L18
VINKEDKNKLRKIRHKRVRKKIIGTSQRPRFNVFRSLNNIYVQIIDDMEGENPGSCLKFRTCYKRRS